VREQERRFGGNSRGREAPHRLPVGSEPFEAQILEHGIVVGARDAGQLQRAAGGVIPDAAGIERNTVGCRGPVIGERHIGPGGKQNDRQ
jgi:hypothetical protein